MTIPDFAVSSQEAGFDEFLKVFNEYFKLSCRGEFLFYGASDGQPQRDDIRWTNKFILPQEAIALLTGKQLTEREKPCANCKETIAECACMRNICVKCNKPVGNITFSHCDKCFDILHSEPTQESVKGEDEKCETIIRNLFGKNASQLIGEYAKSQVANAMHQYSTQQTAHLQQQLKEAKELLEKTTSFCEDENMYPTVYHSINQFLTRNK